MWSTGMSLVPSGPQALCCSLYQDTNSEAALVLDPDCGVLLFWIWGQQHQLWLMLSMLVFFYLLPNTDNCCCFYVALFLFYFLIVYYFSVFLLFKCSLLALALCARQVEAVQLSLLFLLSYYCTTLCVFILLNIHCLCIILQWWKVTLWLYLNSIGFDVVLSAVWRYFSFTWIFKFVHQYYK